MSATTADLALRPAEAEALAVEAGAFAQALPDPVVRARYERVAAAAARGHVPEELVSPLETMLEMVLQRPLAGATQRQVLLGIFGRTPRGRRLAAAADDVNRAFEVLSGQRIERMRLSAGPGSHSLVIETDRCRITLELDASGARVASLETG